jgi:GT2 family glycosyltransferase
VAVTPTPLPEATRLGVTVVTHGPEGEYGPLIASLVEQGIAPASISLVQNPVDPSDPKPPPPAPGVEVLRTARNLAYAGGTNAGIRHHLARGAQLMLCLSQDLRLRKGALGALLECAESAPEYGVLAPVLWVRGEDRIFSYGGRRGRRGGWVSHIKERPARCPDGIAECDWADGAALLVRREVVEQVGLLDESLAHYFEETDFLLRAKRAGWRVGVVLDAEAEQSSGEATRPGFHAYMISRNGFEFARRSAGLLGVAATLRRALVQSWGLVRSYPRAEPAERAATRTKLLWTWRGFIDFLRRRFGEPPASVAGT